MAENFPYSKDVAAEKIESLVNKFSRGFNRYVSKDFEETPTRVEFINPFFTALGWDVTNDLTKKDDQYKDVVHEANVYVKEDRERKNKKPDIKSLFNKEKPDPTKIIGERPQADLLLPTIGHATIQTEMKNRKDSKIHGYPDDSKGNTSQAVLTKDKEKLKEIYKNVTDNVLVACPTYMGKKYALEAYILAYNDIIYPYRGLFMVDNTGDSLKYYEHLMKLGVACDHINPTNDFQETFAMCWKRIYKYAKDNKYKWIMSIEQDNIVPPLTVDTMLNLAGYVSAVHVAHSYPWHKCQSDTGVFTGLGCNLILTELLDKVFNRPKWITDAFESEVNVYAQSNGLVTLDVYNLLDIRHLDDEIGAEYYHFKKEYLPEFTHGTVGAKKPIEDKSVVNKFKNIKIKNGKQNNSDYSLKSQI